MTARWSACAASRRHPTSPNWNSTPGPAQGSRTWPRYLPHGDRTVRRTSLGSAAAIAVLITAFLPAATVPVAATPRSDRGGTCNPRSCGSRSPFPDLRRDQMAAYSRRHYGRSGWRLAPAVIIEHYTGLLLRQRVEHGRLERAPPRREAWRTCAFLIDTDGTIYQLVDREVRCRHAIGLNHVSIGIEHVGHGAGGPAEPRHDAVVVAPDALADGDVRHRGPQRDRTRREPREPVPLRAVRRVALHDPRRLRPPRHAGLPGSTPRPRPCERRPGRPIAGVVDPGC